MIQRIYTNTRPRQFDTYKIAIDKWRQRVEDGAVTGTDAGVVTFSNSLAASHDGKVRVVQKILNSLP